MKTSLNSKVLILSFSAVLLAGTGCERRGRAPVPAKPPVTENGSGPLGVKKDEPTVKPSGTPSTQEQAQALASESSSSVSESP